MQSCLTTFNHLIAQAYLSILRDGNADIARLLLQKLTSVANQYVSQLVLPYLNFSLNRALALNCLLCEDFAEAIKHINPAISQCPKFNDKSFAGGLTETLVLLTEAYSTLERCRIDT